MATTVDKLIVEIKAETKGLRQGLDSVNKKLETANRKAKAARLSFSGLAKVFAVLGLARLATGVVRTVQTFEDLEATLRANTASAEETAIALDMIREFTAKTTFQIEEVTSAFIELKRKGISATREEMKGLGNVAAANNISIKQVAEGVTRAATTSIEQLQMLGFTGKSSGDMITLAYGEGAEKIERTFKKTSRNVMGFVAAIGDMKFATAIEDRANTVTGAFSNLGDNVSEFAKSIGEGGLSESLVRFARGMSVLLNEAKPLAEMIGAGLNKAFELFTEAMSLSRPVVIGLAAAMLALAAPAIWSFLAASVIAVATAIKTLTVSVWAMNAAWLASPITWLIAGLAALGAAIYLLYKNWDNVVTFFQNTMTVTIPNSLTRLQIAFSKMKTAIVNLMNDLLRKIEPVIRKIIEAYNSANLGFTDIEMPDFNISTTDLESGTQALEDELVERTKLLKDFEHDLNLGVIGEGFDWAKNFVMGDPEVESLKEIVVTAKRLGDGMPGTTGAVNDLSAAMAELKDTIALNVQQFTGEFVDSLMDGKNALVGFKDFARDIIKQIITTFLQLMVVNKILNRVFGSDLATADISDLFPGKAAAGGGSVQARRPLLVGERGPEIFMPGGAGRIMNNADSSGALGGSTVVVNQSINFSTGIIPTVRAEVMKMLPQIAEVSKVAVLDAARRGGSYRRGLQGA